MKREQIKRQECSAGAWLSSVLRVAGGEGAGGRGDTAAKVRLTLVSAIERWKGVCLS